MQKIAWTTSVYDTYCLRHWNEDIERKNKKLPHITYDIQISENFQFGVNTIISLAYINLPMYPQQSNLSNPEAYSESCQTCGMFCEKVFVKTSIIDV